MATELGMDESLTAATTQALLDRIRGFVRQQALAEHFARFPEDVPLDRTADPDDLTALAGHLAGDFDVRGLREAGRRARYGRPR